MKGAGAPAEMEDLCFQLGKWNTDPLVFNSGREKGQKSVCVFIYLLRMSEVLSKPQKFSSLCISKGHLRASML